jgi:DNA-binding CsgD family transcriptional regulator
MARLLAAAARASADLAATSRQDDRTSDHDLRERIAGLASSAMPPVAAYLALATAELTRPSSPDADAVSAWSQACALWTRLDSPYLAAYAQWRHAEALLAARGRRHAAARQLGQAYAIALRLGAIPLRDEIQALACRARLRLADPPDERPTAADHGFNITAREEDVLGLLMEGATNREIARVLFISEKTVSIHVSRILAKLGVPNRSAAAAALAQRSGLVRVPIQRGVHGAAATAMSRRS